MKDDPFKRWNLTPVINAAGTMTSIGASRVPAQTRAVVDRILDSFVNMDELQQQAGHIIARLTGAQAGCITGCSAAALTQTVAACLSGTNIARIESLPTTTGENRVLLPMGHMVNYGAPVEQAIRLAGAEVVPVGSAATCETWHLREALERGAVAAMYVVSHHTVRENELPMDFFIGLCRVYDLPAIVDMASEYDLRGPIALGASAAIYSGHKFLSGVTSGIVAGTSELVHATYLQHRGIGRTMKAGKESVVGAMAALELWELRDPKAIRDAEQARINRWSEALSEIPGLIVTPQQDWTGNPITRLKLTIEPDAAGFYAWELVAQLMQRSPHIVVRDDLVEHQQIFLDPCNVTDEECVEVALAIQEESRLLREQGIGRRTSWSEVKRARESFAS